MEKKNIDIQPPALPGDDDVLVIGCGLVCKSLQHAGKVETHWCKIIQCDFSERSKKTKHGRPSA